jgi:TPR repeat protein
MKTIYAVLLALVLGVGCATAPTESQARDANGTGKDKPLPKDFKSLKALAEKGDAKAQYSLGDKYVTGPGVEKDDKEAVKWYRKAAEQNYAPAQHNLGYVYANGEGIEEDDKEAVKWYRKAAEQGYEPAKAALKKLSQ